MNRSSRRTVEGCMGEELYRQLGETPCVAQTWRLLRDLIGEQLFQQDFVPVPHIQAAAYYNQLFVFTKERSVLESLRMRTPTYKIVGNLDYLVNRDVSTWMPQFDFSPWDVADGSRMIREYRLTVTSSQQEAEAVQKRIELHVIRPRVRRAEPPVPRALTIRTNLLSSLQGVQTLYVITDVVLASYIKMSVQIGQERSNCLYNNDTPIGFKYRKYRLDHGGTFLAEMETDLRLTDDRARWLVPEQQPVPTVPRWDPMRRRYTGGGDRKKMRNNLTIPTPENPRPARFPMLRDPDFLPQARRQQGRRTMSVDNIINN